MKTIKNISSKFPSILNDAGILMISSLLVNAGNYALNLCLGRWLGPELFAEANILATLVMVLSFIAVGLQLTVAKYAAGFFATNQEATLSMMISSFMKKGQKISLYLLPVLFLLASILKSYLQFDSIFPLLILFIGVPGYLLFSISRGYFQGTNQFKKLAKTYVVEMVTRVVVTIGLLIIFRKQTIQSEIIAFGFLASFIATYMISKIKTINVADSFKIDKDIITFLAIIGLYELSQILINNSDVLLVKHFFEAQSAGLYSAIALIGRIVFFATWTVVTLLFPKVIEKEKRGESHTHLFWGALILVATIGMAIVSVCYFFDTLIINTLFGQAYLELAHLLWLYALATCLFACANVFAYYHMSLNNYIPVFISITIGLLQIIGIYLFHQNLESVIGLQLILMSILLGTMMIYHFLSYKKQFTLNLSTQH